MEYLKDTSSQGIRTKDRPVRGTSKPGPQVFGLKEGGVGFAVNTYNKKMMAPYVSKLEALRKDIIAGTIAVPSNRQELRTFLQKIGRK